MARQVVDVLLQQGRIEHIAPSLSFLKPSKPRPKEA